MATVKMIITTTPNSCEDKNSCKDDCEDDTHNSDSEDNYDNDGSCDYEPMTLNSLDTTTDKDNNGDGGRGPADTAVDHGLRLHYICVDKPFKL